MDTRPRGEVPTLSKSRFLAGLQCHKRLYLECFHRELADPIDESQQAIFDVGTRVGQLARELYPGILIDSDYFHHQQAVARTREMLSDASVPAIHEAGFTYDDVRTRVDILARAGNGRFDLIEVKSNTSVKEDHVPDVGVQLYVLRGCGLDIRRACLAHLNREYIYPGGDYDLNELFSVEDITADVEAVQPDISLALAEMRDSLTATEPPGITAGRHCNQPYRCPFYDHCHRDQPEHPVIELPRAKRALLELLEASAIDDIRNIPEGFLGLNDMQRRVRDCVVHDRAYLDPEVREALAQVEYPVHFLDFETFNPALPVYVGTRPYQSIPFQWSDHIMTADGVLKHGEFLHGGFDDPREPFALSLLETLGSAGSIVVYSAFEEARIRELAGALPHLSARLLGLLEGRIVDLLKIIGRYCYHPKFHGSFSLKRVLPVLVPDLDYSDLEIRQGDLASLAYSEMMQPGTPPERRESLRQNLLAYCERDTEAMVRLLETLRSGMLPG